MNNICIEYNNKNKTFLVEYISDEKVNLKESLGAKCLYHLISNEGRSFNPVLFRSIIENDINVPVSVQRDLKLKNQEEQLMYKSLNYYIPATDIQAICEINKELKKIDKKLLEAKENHDLRLIDELITEKEACEQYLHESVNRNGTIKNLNTNKRRYTKSISRAIDVVLTEVSDQSEVIYKILKKGIVKSTNQIKFVNWGNNPLIS